MKHIFEQTLTVSAEHTDCSGAVKLSALLHMVQEAAGGHCENLGTDWESIAKKGLFWAVLRHKAQITRLPVSGEVIRLQTWPMPTTRTAYPRAVLALDSQGKELFSVVSLWVLMDIHSRAMVLPAKSGVTVDGVLRGNELSLPASLPPAIGEHARLWEVSAEDLDRNKHVNNARYLDHTQVLADSLDICGAPREFTVCYLAEALLGQQITLRYNLSEDGILSVDGCRPRTDVRDKEERIFALRVTY